MSGYLARDAQEAGNRAHSPSVRRSRPVDVYFSADIETDGPIPGPYSMLSFAIVCAGRYDGRRFSRPTNYDDVFQTTLKPISETFQAEALAVNGINRDRLCLEGEDPAMAMTAAANWIAERSTGGTPVLVAYPLSFDWTWLYWYFIRFTGDSPFRHSRCFDIKTAVAVKTRRPICESGRERLPAPYRSERPHTHCAADDAVEQAEIFARIFEEVG